MSPSTELYIDGHQPSGDAGTACVAWWQGRCIQWGRKKLLAWITEYPNRQQVHIMLLNDNGQPISGTEKSVATAATNRSFYQTAVAWSSNEARWLVTWTDALINFSGGGVGHAYSTWVDFNGNLRPGGNETLMKCDGMLDIDCPGQPGNAVLAPSSILANEYGACKGIWLSSSYYSTATDRYRFQNYRCHRRIDSNGTLGALWRNGCGTYCPITEADYSHDGYSYPFQLLSMNEPNTDHWHLRADSYSTFSAGSAIDLNKAPQGFRSNGFVAAALATSKFWADPTPSDLVLTIVDVYPNPYCPP